MRQVFYRLISVFSALFSVFLPLEPSLASGDFVNSKFSSSLGRLELAGSFVESTLTVQEPQRVSFDFRNTHFAAEWAYQKWLKSRVTIGQEELLGVPSWIDGTPESFDFRVVEAFGEADSKFGKIRLGLVPIGFGPQAGGREEELLFSRSLFFDQNKMVLRDIGLAYEVSHNDFTTRFFVHNGEGGRELDNRTWFTANWIYRSPHWTFEAAATTGETTPTSTNRTGNESVDTVFDPALNAEWRLGQLSIQYVDRYLTILVEGFAARVDQGSGFNEFYSGHIDVHRVMNRSFSLGARYDVLELDRDVSNDRFSELTALLAWHNQYRTSRLTMEVTKRIEPRAQGSADRVLLVWRLTGQGMAFSNRYR